MWGRLRNDKISSLQWNNRLVHKCCTLSVRASVLYTQVYSKQIANVILLLLHVSASHRTYSAIYRLWLPKDGYDLQQKYIGSVNRLCN